MNKPLFVMGVIIYMASMLLLFFLTDIDSGEDKTINRCQADCLKLNMTMQMVNSFMQCVCENPDYPGIRSYPWK